MREILFRGKRADNGEWEYGSLLCFKEFQIFDYTHNCWMTVLGKTVGQYTGLRDKNGKKIFEGDICKGKSIFHDYEELFVIEYVDGGFFFCGQRSNNDYCFDNLLDIEVIGNIRDSKEHLGEETK